MGKNYTGSAGQILLDLTDLSVGDGSRRGPASVDGGQNAALATAAVTSGTGQLGSVFDCTLTCKVFTMVLVEAGAPTTHASVKLEGSLDNVNWYQLITTTVATGTTPVAATTGSAFLQARYVRANVTIAQSGGASPTLTVQVAANN
jgi:hypothetical protein